MYNHSLLKVLSVLLITRRKLGLPVVSTVAGDDMRFRGVKRALERTVSVNG